MERYKDSFPEITIRKIADILSDFGVQLEEEWHEPIDGIFYVTVYCKNTDLTSNGKGSDRMYALASAYGEFIERFQNLLMFRDNDYNFLKSRKLFYDDKYSEELDIINKIKWANFYDVSIVRAIEDKILEYDLYSRFVNINDYNEELFFPYGALDYLYGSNGMASGNTFEEAMVQGICEIIERKVVKEVMDLDMKSTISFNDLTDVLLSKNEIFSQAYDNFYINGWKLHFVDFSMGNKYPVVGALIINKNFEYFFSLGCHLDIVVASERALTELLQGRKVENIEGTSNLLDFERYKKDENIFSIFKTGSGKYPIHCFMLNKIDRLPSVWSNDFTNNVDMLNYLVNLIELNGFNIYIKKLDYMKGYPSVQIIVPNFSEISKANDVKILQFGFLFQKAKYVYEKISSKKFDFCDVDYLINFLIDNPSIKNLSNLFNLPIPIELSNPLEDFNSNLIISMLLIFQHRYEESVIYLKKYINFIENSEFYNYYDKDEYYRNLKYYNYILIILQCYVKGYRDDDILLSLCRLGIDKDYCKGIMEDLKSENVFNNLPQINNGILYIDSGEYNNYEKQISIFEKIIVESNRKAGEK